MTLDDKRTPIEANDLPDALSRWQSVQSLGAESSEHARARTEQSFFVPVDEIREQGYDLSLNRYRQIVHEEVEHRDPLEILVELRELEKEIAAGLERLAGELAPVLLAGFARLRAMDIQPVDVRDLTQEDHAPVYRVWLPRRADASRVSVFEFTDATLDEVDAWAQAQADFGYSLALVHPVAGGLEAIWLRGADPNDRTS